VVGSISSRVSIGCEFDQTCVCDSVLIDALERVPHL
jgi:hypothetical protein